MDNDLLKSQLKELHNQIWKELARTGESKASIYHMIEDFLANNDPNNFMQERAFKELFETLCPACAYVQIEGDGCFRCPLAWGTEGVNGCTCLGSTFKKWSGATGMAKRLLAAKMVLLWR